MLEIAAIFFVSLLITTFIRPAWLNWIVSTAGMFIIFGAAAISIASSGWRDLTPMFLWVGAWMWGMLGGSVMRLIWTGVAQVTFHPLNQLTWLNWALSAFFLAVAAGWIGYAFASNLAVSYAKNMEAAWMLYDRSMAGAAGGFFWLSFAAYNALTAFVKPALTNKGLRAGVAAIVEWKEFNSYEWQANKLIMHRKTKLFSRWSNDSQFVVNPAEQEAVNRVLSQHLPNLPVQPPTAVQVLA
jgi:hypothetical protein